MGKIADRKLTRAKFYFARSAASLSGSNFKILKFAAQILRITDKFAKHI